MGQKIALIIGNSEYQDRSLARLIAPSADVSALATVLRSAEIGGFDEATTLVNESATTVRVAIARFFADKKRDDLLVLYFSGHGVLDERGQLYLAVKDTERTLPKGTAIEASFITDVMDSSNSRRQVLILDCCHSGAFARGAKGTPGASVHTATAFEGIGTGRVVLTATDATQYAWEGDQVVGQAETSVFTRFLIQGLQTGEADADVDGNITLDELYDYAYTHVVTETPKQTPGKWSYKQQGDIVIARNPRPLAKQVALPPEIQQSIEDARPWVREGVIGELDRLLNGRNLALSQAAHEALKRLTQDDSHKVAAAAAQSLSVYEASSRVEAERVVEEERPGQERLETEPPPAEMAKQQSEAESPTAQQAEEEPRRDEGVEYKSLEAERPAALKAQEERIAQEKANQEPLAREKAQVLAVLPQPPRRRFTRRWILSGLIVLGVLATLTFVAIETLHPKNSTPYVFSRQTKTSGCVSTNGLPDSACTPGSISQEVTKDQVCAPGYLENGPDVAPLEMRRVFDEYGITSHPPGEYEVDHLIPYELGGRNDIANLWPQPAKPSPGFHEKDTVENYLHAQVCNGAISMQDAQHMIATDWLSVYNSMPK